MNLFASENKLFFFLKKSVYFLIMLGLAGLIQCSKEDSTQDEQQCSFPAEPHWLTIANNRRTSIDNGVTWCKSQTSSYLLSENEGDYFDIATDGNGHWVTFVKEFYGEAGDYNNIVGYSSDGGNNWTKSTFTTPGNSNADYFMGIAYGSGGDAGTGTWLMVGSNNSVYRSSDGTDTWTAATTPFSGTGYDVAYDGSSRWVSVGSFSSNTNSIAYSDDNGDTWTVVGSSPGTFLHSIAHNGSSRWVAVGMSGIILYSDDGTTWVTVTSDGFTDNYNSVAIGNGRWVAVGESGKIRTSTNGMDWTDASPAAQTTTFHAVGYDGNGHWLAVGLLGIAYYSTEGVTWTESNVTPDEPDNQGLSIFNIGFGK